MPRPAPVEHSEVYPIGSQGRLERRIAHGELVRTRGRALERIPAAISMATKSRARDFKAATARRSCRQMIAEGT
jgi:hypothetical protein